MKWTTAVLAALAFGGGMALTRVDATSGGHQPKGPRVLVLAELFTSEGCSSCPPADDLLRQLLRDQPVDGVEVLPISEHVDYWNRLGWRDPFSSAQFSERQNEYARAFGSGQIYTPQLVVDGSVEAVGNDFPAVRDALLRAAHAPHANVSVTSTRLDIGQKASVRVVVSDLPSAVVADAIDVVVAVVEDGLATDVPRGENARRRLRHDAVARVLGRVGTLTPSAASGEFTSVVDLGEGGIAKRLRVVAFLQDRKTRRVAGVAAGDLK